MEWKQIIIGHEPPKSRRRLSCIIVSKHLVMFGGFDGEFYNDLNIMILINYIIQKRRKVVKISYHQRKKINVVKKK
jgi:hypothetical protein